MLKKSLLSLSIAASLAVLSGCNISSTTDNAGAAPAIQEQAQANHDVIVAAAEGIVTPVFNPIARQFPLGIDFIFASQASDSVATSKKDGTADSGAEFSISESPVTDAVDDLDGGISTLAPIDIPMTGTLDASSVTAGSTVHLIKLPNAADAASLVLPNGVSAADIDALDLASIGNFFYDQKPDGTAPASAAETVVGQNLASIIGMQPVPDDDYEVQVISIDGGNDNVIRINPLKPLEAKTKYIVLLTGGITANDVDNTPIQASSNYKYVQGSETLFTNALAGVRASVQGWEAMAGAILTAGGANPTPLADGIALTAGFTTGDPKAVLTAMAYPGYWAPSVITNDAIAQAVINAGYSTADTATFPSLAAYEAYLDSVTGNTGDKKIMAIPVANGALTSPNAALGDATAYEHPRARTFEIIPNVGGAGVDQLPVSTVTAGQVTNNVLISQGAIELPQYTYLISQDASDHWEANTVIGNVLDGALGQTLGTTPPGDLNGSKNVTYRYPFAAQKRTAVVPLMMVQPTTGSGCTQPGAGWPVIIMQHGFQNERSSNVINASNISELTCSVVIAMDLPHHGVSATSTRLVFGVDYVNTSNASLTPFAAAKAAAVAALDAESTILDSLSERHENFYGLNGVPTSMTFADDIADAEGDSGSLFIRLDNFQRARDNLRQATMDLLNLNASLVNIDVNGDGSTTNELDLNNVSFVGHSLGAIVGTAFVAVNNKVAGAAGNPNLNEIQSAILATPGGHLTKLIENSVGIGPSVLGGLQAANGLSQGDDDLESYMKIFQATLDSADPMNFVSELAVGGASETPILVIGMYGNGTTNPSDLVVPVNGNGIQIAANQYVLADGSTTQAETARNPLVGLDPMLSLLNAVNIQNAPAVDQIVAKYNEGGHGTFSSAGNGTSGAPDFDSEPAYLEMLNQSVDFLGEGAILPSAVDASNDVTPANTGVLITDVL